MPQTENLTNIPEANQNQLLPTTYFHDYQDNLKEKGVKLAELLENLAQPQTFPSIDYYNQVSAVYSSKIEGNSLDLNSFLNGTATSKQKDKQEIEDLLLAYRLAEKTDLDTDSLLLIHKILSKNLLIKEKQGVWRYEKMGVFDDQGLVYMAIEPEKVAEAMKQFMQEIQQVLQQKLTLEKVFYFASLIHLRFAHIHPFADGNGRVARILEKWFLAQKIGQKAWWIPTEKYYFENRSKYYNNINLGVDYYEIDYSKSLPFLQMLLEGLKETQLDKKTNNSNKT